jgi:hypothetical protein
MRMHIRRLELKLAPIPAHPQRHPRVLLKCLHISRMLAKPLVEGILKGPLEGLKIDKILLALTKYHLSRDH